MNTINITPWLLAASLLAGCAAPPAPPSGINPAIMGEFDKAAARKPEPRPREVDAALLPPLRMEMPEVAGKPIEPRFDLSVSNAPAQQVFMSLVSGTRYSMLVHPAVTGAISVSLKDVTLEEALDSIRELYGYEYRIEGSRISIQAPGLQTRLFRVNYLTGQRRGTSDLRVQSGSVSDVSGGGGAPQPVSAAQPIPGAVPGAGLPVARSIDTSRVSTQQSSDFWAELRTSLAAIVGTAEGRSVVVSPQSGIVVVRALPPELRAVEQFLRETRLAVERQVMLEAKIVEVTLSEGYQAGINWALFRSNFQAGQISPDTRLGGPGQPLSTGSAGGQTSDIVGRALTLGGAANPIGAIFGLALQTTNFATLLQFLQSQGNVQVLSSPRIATLNNQKAVLKVGTDEFFVTNVSTVTTTTGTTTQQTPTVTVAPFFSGVLLDVTPQIDDSGSIMLHIHPSVSEVTESQLRVELGGTIPSITLPLARSSINETDTIVRVTDGNIVAIGGLMKVDVRDDRGGPPGISEAIGFLRNADRQSVKREIVILLKPTVVHGDRVWEQDVRDTQERLRGMAPHARPQ